ncbi:hypothetical protein C2E23DRAFT_885612 [Lenzites betulinus]|nr:hypothetical protein C2E23DRAFT_885612 [Lenzites betulinus]
MAYLTPSPPKTATVSRKIPATIRYTEADGSVHEREVCKLHSKGFQCRRGDECRYVHLTSAELDSFDTSGDIDSGDPTSATSNATASGSNTRYVSPPDCPTQVFDATKVENSASSYETTRPSKKPRAVCRMHFQQQRCRKLPCKYSHDVLDLATQLPPNDQLVLKHADAIRDALKKRETSQAVSEPPKSTTLEASQAPPVADTAKKRQKKPRKPGTDATVTVQETSDLRSGQMAPTPKGKGRSEENIHVTPSKVSSAVQRTKEDNSAIGSDAMHDPVGTRAHTEHDVSVKGRDVASQHVGRAMLPCYSYIHGRCNYGPDCRFSHDIDREQMLLEFREKTRAARAEGGSSTERPYPTLAPEDGSPLQTTGLPLGNKQTPLFPPGLGLEMQFGNRAKDTAKPHPSDDSMTLTVLDATKVTFGPGFVITNVTTGFECRQITLEDIPASVTPATLTKELEVFGPVTAVVLVDTYDVDNTATFKVTFGAGEAAAEAVSALNGNQFFGNEVTAQLVQKTANALGGGTLYDGDVLFELPTPWQIGFVGYASEVFADKAIEYAKTVDLGSSQIIGEKYKGIPVLGDCSVRFRNLPPHFEVKDIKKHFFDRVVQAEKAKQPKKPRAKGRTKGKTAENPNSEKDTTAEIYQGAMVQRGKYNSLQGAFQGLKRMLQQYDEDVSINALPPPYRNVIRVWAHFSNADVASQACAALDRYNPRFVGKGRIFAHHFKTMRYQLPAPIFDVLRIDIDLLRSYILDDHNTTLSVLDKRESLGPGASVTIKLVSKSMESLTKSKATFENLLRGEKVMDRGQILWNDYFGSRAGQAFLHALENENPMVKISSDTRRRSISLFGVRSHRERVNDLIVHRVRQLKAQLTHRYPVSDLLIGVFMSADLVDLQRELGHENVWFDISSKHLVIRGDEDAQKVAQLAILHARQRHPRRAPGSATSCPVCLGDVSHPVTLACGHTWCKACLAGYLTASVSTKTFPLTCLADEARCARPIALATAQRLLSTEEFDRVLHAAFAAHVQQRPAEFRYCPTPDCPQVYRTAPAAAAARAGAAVLQCPACLVRICAHCSAEAHERTSCVAANPEDEQLFELWKTGHDVKHCPHCKVPIERAAGCNHMTCVSCKIHICWACLETFSRSGDVYDHMRGIHGGIGY